MTDGEHPRSIPPGERVLSVLVVDDEPAICRALSRLLRSRCRVTVAVGGREALSLLASEREYDVVLCDLMMPELSGAELFELMRTSRPELARRFVFMTGGAFTPHAREFLAKVENARIDKPIDPRALRALLEELRRA